MARARFVDTTHERIRALRRKHERTVRLTIAYHADPSRVGEVATLDAVGSVEVSRLDPLFARPGQEGRPLDDPFISRKPIILSRRKRALVVENPEGHDLFVDGVTVDEHTAIDAARLELGVTIELGGRLVLLAHDLARTETPPPMAFVGASEGLDEVRRTVVRVAKGPSKAVLVTAESGSGKELVARAIHEQSNRKDAPFVAINVGALVSSTVASELFGHAKGAFTGADDARVGVFERANGGTLLLDEIGEAPLEVQASLLRVLETGEIQPVGGEPKTVDVRVVAATDADLEAGVESGTFRTALFHRLAESHLEVPPLRERRADVGLLLAHFLTGAEDRTLEPRMWLSTSLVSALIRAAWPGNVRQLRNVARFLATERADQEEVEVDDALTGLVGTPPVAPTEEGDLLDVLRRHRFQLNRAAEALGISRSTLDRRISRDPNIRKAKDLTADEIHSALEGQNLDDAAAALEVSARGLKLRMAQLGIGTTTGGGAHDS